MSKHASLFKKRPPLIWQHLESGKLIMFPMLKNWMSKKEV